MIFIIITETYPNYAESFIDKVDKCERAFPCLEPIELFKVNIFFVAFDSLMSNIKKRSEKYRTINNKFKTIFHERC